MNVSVRLFGAGKKDALAMIKNKEDQIFLESMKSDKAALELLTKRKLNNIEKKQNVSKKKLSGKNVMKLLRSKR